MSMTSRERVQAVLNHELPDRVPIILGVSNATGIKIKPYQGLKKILDIEAPDEYIYDWPELGTAKIDEKTMRIDFPMKFRNAIKIEQRVPPVLMIGVADR